MTGVRSTEMFFIENILVGDRLRHVKEAAVERMAASMQEIGLRTPITVRLVEDEEGNQDLILVAGATRLAAAKRLGWKRIECFLIEGDEIDARLWEIDENLARAELTAAEEAEHLRERKRLWEARSVSFGTTCPETRREGRPGGFASDVAKVTGEDKRSVNRKIARASAIAPDVMEIVKGTHLDRGVYLDALKPLSHEEQHAKVAADLAAPRAKPVPPASAPLNDFEISNKRRRALVRAWEAASPEDREWFRCVIDRPVFDAGHVAEAAE